MILRDGIIRGGGGGLDSHPDTCNLIRTRLAKYWD